MYKHILLSTLLSASLLANSISFENAPLNPKHRLPNGKNEILSFNEILKEPMQSVVNIATKTIINNRQGQNRLFNDPFFQKFFGQGEVPQQQTPQKRDNALGSGVIISKDGYIVTNNHVLTDADEISVTIQGSDKIYIAKVIGKDKDSDLAVIKIDAKNLQPIRMGHLQELRLGDVVFAIGNPFGVGQTVTQGIISALNKDHVGINKYEHFIQTDASINPGNSGGALIDSRGALIGINAAILSETGGNHGIGFSIPIDMVRNVVTKLIKDGKVNRGYMGVNISKVTEELKKLYVRKKGAIVTDVQINSPAQKAALQRGDLIFAVNDKSVKSPSDLQRLITSLNPKDEIKLSIERDKKELTKKLLLGDLNGEHPLSSNYIETDGLRLSELTNEIKQKFKIPTSVKGVFIEGVLERSQAEMSGFVAGDVLIQIENKKIENLKDAQSAFTKFKGLTKRVYVNREGFILLLVTK
jgi:serine protease Do